MRKLLIICFIFFLGLDSMAGRTSALNRSTLGIRVGNFVGLDYKYFFSNTRDFSLQLHLNQKPKSAERGELTRFSPFIMYQKEIRFLTLPYKVFWFYGGGAHLGVSEAYMDSPINELGDKGKIIKREVGVDGSIGIELYSRKIPFTVAFDWSPYYNFEDIVDDNEWLNMGVSLRFKLGMKHR